MIAQTRPMFFLLDFIFPKKCVGCGKFGQYFCKGCFAQIEFVEKPICPVCQRQAIEGRVHPGCSGKYRLDGLVVACGYSGPVKRAIAKVKYKWVWDIEKIFVELLVKNLWRFDLPENVILVPVPLHFKRKNWRGFNQSEILAKSLASKFNVEYLELLIRKRETRTQVGLTRDERKENVRGAFKIMAEARGRSIILVDDVFTSGATMAECANVLKRAGAKSAWGMAVALG